MNDRTLLLVVALAATVAAAPLVGAEESTVDEAQDRPGAVAVGEAVRAANETTQSSIARAFHETWEDAGSIEEAGWGREYLDRPKEAPDDPWRRVHRRDDNPFPGPEATPIATESPPHAVTIMQEGRAATYPNGIDARLTSPTLDLRYVRGQSTSTTDAYTDEDTREVLTNLADAYDESVGSDYGVAAPYNYLLVSPPSEWFPVPCPDADTPFGVCGRVDDPTPDPRTVTTPGGGEVAAGVNDEDEAVLVVQNPGSVEGPFISIPLPQERVVQTHPVPGTKDYGLYPEDDGDLHAPNPVDEREGLTYINVTFWHRWDLAENDGAYLEVRERRDDGSWSEWRYLKPDEVWNQPNTEPSSRYHEEQRDDRTETYNGWLGDKRAFVGDSDGLVASTFNLNRFAGTEIQLAWRVDSQSRVQTNDLGWFIDDVVVWTNTYQRDVGIQAIDEPREGDRVAPSDPFRPSATVKNYGHLPMHEVQVTYRVTPEDDTGTTLWKDVQTLDRIGPQEAIRTTAESAFDPAAELDDPGGAYRLVANVTPYSPSEDPAEDNLTHRPETTPDDENNERVQPFQVQRKAHAEVDVELDDGSIQTDLGQPKSFTVEVENTGNVPLDGALEVAAVRLDRTTLKPAGEAQVIDRVRIAPGELPYGTTLNAFGSEDNTWIQAFTWEKGLDTQGTYRITATFEAGDGTFDGSAPAYVRSTPAAYYREGAEDILDLSFDDDSVYSVDMTVDSWTTSVEGDSDVVIRADKALPDPVSPSHVWFGRGDDGQVGTRGAGGSVEEAAGANETLETFRPIGYDEAEPDQRPVCYSIFRSFSLCDFNVVSENADTRDPNTLDHYWLTRDVDLNASEFRGADEILLAFWHAGSFDWTGQTVTDETEASHSRGRVEVLPREEALFADPLDGDQDEVPDAPEAETDVDTVDDRLPSPDRDVAVVPGDEIYAQTLASYETDVPWTREVIDLTPWKGQNVTVRFHLETTTDRTKVNDSDAGQLTPWLVDNVELSTRSGGDETTVAETDLEGDDWRDWSTAKGVQVETSDGQLSPVTALEGRGWDRHDYGSDVYPSGWKITNTRTRPEAGTMEQSPMFRWGDPEFSDHLPRDVNLSILRTPAFSLDTAREPALSFLHNHSLPSDAGDIPLSTNDWGRKNNATTGGSVWIVGENDEGEEVVRELLTPAPESEATYDDVILNYYSNNRYTDPDTAACADWEGQQGSAPGKNELHCTTPLRHYPAYDELENETRFPHQPQGNVFTGDSGPGEDPRWERAVFDLSEYASGGNASLDYHIEFHAINQRNAPVEGVGWLVDKVRVTERTFANDMGVDEIVDPDPRTAVGPGLKVPVAVKLQNEGLYDQAGVQASYVVKDESGEVVFGPVEQNTEPGVAIPGDRNTADPDKNHTIVFDKPWETPLEEGNYILEARVDLDEALPGNAYPDANPANDVLREEITVLSRRSVGIQPAVDHPDDEVVDPFVGTTESFRTFEVLVENKGTLPEVFTGDDAGNFAVNLTIEDSTGDTVKTTESPIRRLAPGEVRSVTFPSAWKPETTGVYEVTVRLDHPNETVQDALRDNERTITYTVFEQFLPREDEDLSSTFRTDDPGWSFEDGAWTFGRGDEYRNGADDALILKDPLSVRNLRQGVLRLNHSYSFETGYDGGLVEVKPVDGDTWHPVPPVPVDEGYPVEMTAASPFADDPVEAASGDVTALSGTSGDGEEPETVETAFDLGGVEALTFETSLLDDPLEDGFGESDSVRLGDWSSEYLSRVEPRSGDVMFHSNASSVEPKCWRYTVENNWYEENSGKFECDTNGFFESTKYLNLTFDGDFPDDRLPLSQAIDDVQELRITFWDYKAIGLVLRNSLIPSDALGTETSLRLECIGDRCPENAVRVLDPRDESGYDDNYRGWTKNVYTIPKAALAPFAGPGKDIRVSFAHHALSGNSDSEWSTDGESLHGGWFVDDVAVELVDDSGQATTYWSDDLETYERTYEKQRPEDEDTQTKGRQEVLKVGEWDGGSWTDPSGGTFTWTNKDHDRLLWDPVHGWGGEALCRLPDGDEEPCDEVPPQERDEAEKRHGLWRHVEAGEKPCGELVDEESELYSLGRNEGGDGPTYPDDYLSRTDHFRACGPTSGDRDRAGGARLTTDVNLRPAVGNVTLTFDHKYRFRSQVVGSDTMARSAGRLEVSVDDGQTWIPLEPEDDRSQLVGQEHVPTVEVETADNASTNAYTTLGGREGDPEGNSIYGKGGFGFTGVSGFGAPAEQAETVTATYDLTRFAGRNVKIAWHSYFGTRDAPSIGNDVHPDSGAYEFWAIEDVTVDAEVFDGDRLDLRLRAASDGTKPDEGWTVNSARMAGTNTRENVGAEIMGLPEGRPVEAGDTPFKVAVENAGEVDTRVDVTVTVEDADGNVHLDATETGLPLVAEGRVVLDAVDGEDLEVRLKDDRSYEFRVTVRSSDPGFRLNEAIEADNTDAVVVDDIRSQSDLEIRSLRADPNDVDEGETVTVEATVENDGFDQSNLDLDRLNLSFEHRTEEASHTLTGGDELANDPGKRFRRPFQTKTLAWELTPEDVGLPAGPYDVTAHVEEVDGAHVSEETASLHVGSDVMDDLGYRQTVPNATGLNGVDTCRFERESSGGDGTTGGQADTNVYWGISEVNRSLYRSFSTDTASGSLLCEFDGLDVMDENLHLDFFSRHAFDDPGFYTVTFGAASDNARCFTSGSNIVARPIFNETGQTPGFVEERFGHEGGAVDLSRIPDDADTGCIEFTIDESVTQVNVDDILVSPFSVSLSPSDSSVTIQDDTRKRFPFQVTNEGSYNDTYRFAFVDASGEPPNVPRSWDLSVETADGTPVETVDLAAHQTRTLYFVVEIPVQGAASNTGVTSAAVTAISETDGFVRDTATYEFRFDYPPRPNLDVISASVNNPELAAGQPRSVTVTVANVGVEPVEDVPVEITDTMPPRFGEPPRTLTRVDGQPLPNITLKPGQTTTLIAGWTPARAGPHNLTVHVDAHDDVVESNEEDNVQILEVPIETAKFPDLAVSIDPSEPAPEAGSSITVNGTITNEGEAPAQGVRVTYRVGVSDLLEGEAPHILGEPIEPGETVELQATWPASFPGDYKAFLKAVPLSGALEPADRQDDNLAVANVTVRSPSLQVDAGADVLNASQADEVGTPFTVENRGDTDETVDVTATAEGDLRARITRDGVSVTRVDVPAGNATTLHLQVRTPTQAVAGTYPVTVTATSTKTDQTEDVTVPVTVEEEPGLALEARAVDVDPGGGTVPLRLENTGNVPATVEIDARDLPRGWSVDGSATLEPFSTAEVQARLDVPTDAPAGVRDLVVEARTDGAADAARLRADVATRSVLDVQLDPGEVALRPGSTVTFNATLDSVGNAPAFPDFAVEAPDDWNVTLPRPRAQVPDGESLSFPIRVGVPGDADGGTRTVELVAEGESETFLGNATVDVGVPDIAVTNVEQNPRVNIEGGEEVTFTTTVRNPGGLGVDETGVGLYVDDALVDYVTARDLSAGGKAEVTVTWSADPGEHVILLVSDPGEEIREEDEGNNARLFVVQVGGDAQVFGNVERAVPAHAALGLVALAAAALGRRWRT